jgi:tRNA-binding EMAP/Myf-like protein
VDPVFASLLIHNVTVKRPTESKTGELNLGAADYEDVYPNAVPARVVPARSTIDAGILGAFPDATHLAYCGIIDAAPGYLIERTLASSALAAPAAPGATQVSVASSTDFRVGHVVELGAEPESERAHVVEVQVGMLRLQSPIVHAFAEGDPVRAVLRFDVLGVEDEAGAGHHLRLTLRERAL